MRPDQQRVQALLTDTVTLLCKNGLKYNKALKVQGLLGITLDDDDVFIVHINKIFDGVNSKPVNGSDNNPALFINGLAGLNSFNQFENVDGLSYEEEEVEEPLTNGGMQLPVIHAQQTSILSSRSTGPAKKNPTPLSRGVKRPVGAARRKESRVVKQRVNPRFQNEIHHVQMNKDSGFTPQYQEIHIKDEPPDQLIITNSDIRDENNPPPLDTVSQTSTFNSSSRDSFPAQNSIMTYESLESCDSPVSKKNDQTQDMIECLLYNEGMDQTKSKVHISGVESSCDSMSDDAATYTNWEDMEENQKEKEKNLKSVQEKKEFSPVIPGTQSLYMYNSPAWSDINQELNILFKDKVESSSDLTRGFPCADCPLVLKNRKVWMEHMKGIHRNRTYDCNICNRVFKWRSARNKHVERIHHKWAAPAGDDYSNIHHNMAISPKDDDIICHKMAAPPGNDTLLVKHQSSEVKEIENQSNKATEKIRPNEKDQCSDSEENQSSSAINNSETISVFKVITSSMINCVEPKVVPINPEQVELFCKHCPKTFSSLTMLSIHKRQQHPEHLFSCGLCPKLFSTRSGRNRHVKNLHTIKPCDIENVAENSGYWSDSEILKFVEGFNASSSDQD